MKRFLAIVLSLAMLLPAMSSIAEGVEDTSPITFTMFVDHTWYWTDTFEDEVAKEVTKRTGVYFDITRATDSNQLPVLLASGDLPDIIYTANTSVMNELRNPDVCYSYNELVERTGADLNADETEILLNTAPDGNYYSLLNTFASQEQFSSKSVMLSAGMNTVDYRRDIYEELGSPEINTLEDLENLLLEVKEKYPDMVPIVPVYEYEALNYFKQALGVFDANVGYNADGKVAYKLHADGIKEYYQLLNKWAREGLLSAEAETYTFSQVMELAYAGKCFAFIRATGNAGDANQNAKETGTGYRWDVLEQDLSDETLRTTITAGWSGWFITKNCKDPERAIKFFEFCRSDEGRKLMCWGIEGQHWEYNDEGLTQRTQYYYDSIAAGKEHQKDLGCGAWIFGDKGDENSFVDNGVSNEVSIHAANRRTNCAPTMHVWSELGLCLPTDGAELNIYNKLNDMVQSEELKLIFADSDEAFEAAYENMQTVADSIGIDKLETYLNDRLAELSMDK